MWRWCFVGALVAGCSQPLPCAQGKLADSYTLIASGITVEVTRAPYRYTVKDGTGNVVLATTGLGQKDGYGTVGWTSGQVFWGNNVSPGYFTFDTNLDPWRDDWQVVAATQSGPTALEVTLAHAGDPACVHETFALRDSTVRVEARLDGGVTPRAWESAFASPADEAFMGFGERYNRVDQRGLEIYSWAEEGGLGASEATPKGPSNPWPNGESMTYYPVPFFVSSKGYGFWLDSTWRNQFALASDRADAWRVWELGPKTAYEVYVPIPNDPRPWPQHLVDLFTATTGRPMIPAPWTLGPRRRFGRDSMVNGVLEAQAMRDNDLAITSVDDNLHFLPAGDDLGNEPTIRAWMTTAAALGYRVDGYYNPYLSKDPSPLDAQVAMGLGSHYFLQNGDGTPSVVWLISGKFLNLYTVDVTNADATAWFTGMFGRAIDLGYSGWMYDFGEYVQPEVLASNGMTGEELHNLFPVLYDRAAHDALDATPRKGDWHFYARSGYTGSTQYTPVVWGGDPDASFDDALGLPTVPRGAINIGWSGVANWGSDIGGFKCGGQGHAGADGELIARWIEVGALSSDMHDEDACADAMDAGQKANIWTAPDAMTAWKTYARLHTRLFPYLYSQAVQAHATGAPQVRSLFFEHADPSLVHIDDQFYLGDALLVAPVVHRGDRSRQVVLPAGNFLDWRSLQLFNGPTTITADAPLVELPLYLRDGFLVPMLDPTIDTLAEENDAAIVSPADVSTVYDVVGLLSTKVGVATFTLADGTTLTAHWTGNLVAPAVQLAPNLKHAQIVQDVALPSLTSGGLTLDKTVARTIRWDLYLVEP